MDAINDAPAGVPFRRFSLRSLLAVLGAACVILAPFQWYGAPYLVSAGFSVALIVGCVLLYRASKWAAAGAAIAAAVLGFPIAIAMLVFFVHAIFNLVACLVLIPLKPQPRIFAMLLAAVMVAIYGFAFSQGAAKRHEIRALKEQYPFESLSSRLAFEQMDPAQSTDAMKIQLSAVVSSNLDEQDESLEPRYFSKAYALRELHENSYREFVRAAGFGYMRMPSLTYRLVDLEPATQLSLPSLIRTSGPTATTSELYDAHRIAVLDFLSPERTGYVKSRDAVAGFESHQFSLLNRRWPSESPAANYWQVVRLELVGLLRGEARVYLVETIPPMDQIAEVSHRELNEFEKSALPQLISQTDVVVDRQPERIQMLGAVRAGTSCLTCHEGNRGKLLGAFSYELTPLDDYTPKHKQAEL